MTVDVLVVRFGRWWAVRLCRVLFGIPWRFTTERLNRYLVPSYRFGIRDAAVERASKYVRLGALAIFWLVTLRWKRMTEHGSTTPSRDG